MAHMIPYVQSRRITTYASLKSRYVVVDAEDEREEVGFSCEDEREEVHFHLTTAPSGCTFIARPSVRLDFLSDSP